MGKRDYYPGSTKDVCWFEIIDKDGNNIKLNKKVHGFPLLPADSADPYLAAWDVSEGESAGDLKQKIIGESLGLDPNDYRVYGYASKDEYIEDDDVVDFDYFGLKKNKPLAFIEKKDGDTDDENEDDNDNEENEQENENGNEEEEENESNDNDPYRLFIRPLECTSNADWSRYPGAIQNTYQGEILWTDGNLAYGVANMMGWMAVRRVPNTPDGVVQPGAGRAPDNPAYFVLRG